MEAIVRQAAYLNIIDHPNYNPRIVEHMTDPMWVGDERPTQYPAMFLQNLQKPFLIWEKAFSNHLTDTTREMLLVLGTLPSEVFVKDFELATKRFVSRRGREINEKKLRRALAELQGNFIVLKQDRGNDIVAFHSPSVQDFIDNYLEKNQTLYMELGESACFFEQVQWLCENGMTKGFAGQIKEILLTGFEEALLARPCTLINYSSNRGRSTYKERTTLSRVERLAFLASLIKKREFDFLEDMFRGFIRELSTRILDFKPSNEALLSLVKEVVALDGLVDLKTDFLVAAKESLFQNVNWISDIYCLTNFLELCTEMYGSEDDDRIVKVIEDIVDYCLEDEKDPQFLSNELHILEKIEQETDLALQSQIESVSILLSSAEDNYPPEEDYNGSGYVGSSSGGESIGDGALLDMFLTLLR